ncbi:MAG TPA: hemerythrin domain-containing protein [Microthrixaceae bacterium]|nr:hemerythrin domain-containing protein [Microthrixaceae bacterium]
MELLDHLTQEHRKVEELLGTLASSDEGPAREATLAELESSLSTHMAVEETFLYPLVTKVIGAEDEEEAEVEHGLARDGVAKLRELVAEPGFGAAVDMVTAGIGHHVKEEEQELFPQLRAEAADQVRALGTPDELEAKVKSKSELYDQAKDAGVRGRSRMSKDELAEAVGDTKS